MRTPAAAAIVFAGALAGCTGGRADRVVVAGWQLEPAAPAVGIPVRAEIELRDGRGPVRGARLELEAHMAHPGMRPVVVPARERTAGRYQGDIRFTMSGRWTLVASATLPDGTRVTRPLGGTDVP